MESVDAKQFTALVHRKDSGIVSDLSSLPDEARGEDSSFEKLNNSITLTAPDVDTLITPDADTLIALDADTTWILDADFKELPIEEASSVTQLVDKKRRKSFTVNLKSFLEKDGDGKVILSNFKINKCLNKSTRALLTRTIIKNFKHDALNRVPVGQKLAEFHIPTETFIALSEEIEALFPGEIASTYYSPYISEDQVSVPPSGRLYNHYNYVKDSLRSSGLLANWKKKKIETSTFNTVETNNDNEDVEWLKKNLEPWNDVCEKWKATYNFRKTIYAAQKSVSDYINKFPCLKVQDAKELYLLDFERLYPNNSSSLYSRWDKIKDILLKQLQALSRVKGKVKEVSDQAWIHLLPSLESQHQNGVILHLPPLLIDIGRPGKRAMKETENLPEIANQLIVPKKRVIKRNERLETFVQHVELASDLDRKIRELRDKLLKSKDTFQPMIFIIGPLTKIEQAVVVLDEQQHRGFT